MTDKGALAGDSAVFPALRELLSGPGAWPDPMLPRPFRVVGTRRETHDTVTLELVPVEERARFPFSPGQFNMLYRFGVGEVPISISGDPGETERLVHTLRAVGTVTRSLAALAPGDTVGVRGPYGTHWPLEAAVGKDVVIVAGGIGLAPLRPVLFELSKRRERYGRITVLYGARTPDDVLFEPQLQVWRGADFDVAVTVDRGARGWCGRVGVVTMLIPGARFEPRDTVAMVCGPEIMARFSVLELRKRGVLGRNIHVSMERNMKCGVGLCGHCQYGAEFVCKDGPVFSYARIRPLFHRSGV